MLVYLEFLTGAIGSPQGPTHYDVMSRIFNKASKNDVAHTDLKGSDPLTKTSLTSNMIKPRTH